MGDVKIVRLDICKGFDLIRPEWDGIGPMLTDRTVRWITREELEILYPRQSEDLPKIDPKAAPLR